MIEYMPQNTPEWLQFRRTRIGASDAPIIMNASPYKTLFELWHEKNADAESQVNDAMIYGRKNEETARNLFETMTGFIMFPNFMATSDTNPWQVASLDGITIEGNAIVELKCANAKDHALASQGMLPPKYVPQVQHQLACTGLDHAFYFSWRQGEGIIIDVPRDQAYIDWMTKLELHFYTSNMLANVPPEMQERDIKKMLKQESRT